MSSESLENQKSLVQVGAKVPVELRDAVEQLAADGNRSVSRQVRQALREHVERSGRGSFASSSPPQDPAERRVPGEPAVEAQALAGQ
jgi:hypothetical protein